MFDVWSDLSSFFVVFGQWPLPFKPHYVARGGPESRHGKEKGGPCLSVRLCEVSWS